MSEILFRGKRTDNGEWIHGFPYITHGGEHQIKCYDPESNIESCTYTVAPDSVGRYIGRTDAYGNKMFEGDIIKYDDWCGVVVFDNDDAQFVVQFTDGDIENFCNLCSGDCEIYGNVYDNPEWQED